MRIHINSSAYDVVENAVRQAVASETHGWNPQPDIVVDIHGEANAAYEKVNGLVLLRLDVQDAVREALRTGAAIIRDMDGNTVGSVVVDEAPE